jgi:hypothetical protein
VESKVSQVSAEPILGPQRATGLVDVLDRVLDKGLLIAGDVKISLAEVELLTIRIRLIVCSLDKAQEIGLDWWRHDPHLVVGRQALNAENAALRRQVRLLERRLAALGPPPGPAASPRLRRARARRNAKGRI